MYSTNKQNKHSQVTCVEIFIGSGIVYRDYNECRIRGNFSDIIQVGEGISDISLNSFKGKDTIIERQQDMRALHRETMEKYDSKFKI